MFNDIETVMHILSCAAVRKIVDSSGRVLGIGPDKMEAACQVALNGPPLAQSENIIEAAQRSWPKISLSACGYGDYVLRKI